jgi:hypothetical protein
MYNELLFNLRHKENRTEQEELLLSYFRALSLIGEALVSESKQHISTEDCVNKIRSIMQKL